MNFDQNTVIFIQENALKLLFAKLPFCKQNLQMWKLSNENVWIMINISLKFISNGPVNEKAALIDVITWHWTGDKPLPKPMMIQFTEPYLSPGLNELITEIEGVFFPW